MNKIPFRWASVLVAVSVLSPLSAAVAAGSVSSLPTTVVSATGFQQEVLRAPASITVVGQDGIQRKPGADLAEVLRAWCGNTMITPLCAPISRKGISIPA